MSIKHFIGCVIPAGTLLFGTSPACAQTYPSKPIRIITSAPGNGDDLAARLIAQGVAGALGQQVVVDNRGFVAVEMVAKAAPDGYTVLLYGSPMWLPPVMRGAVPYDPGRGFFAVPLGAGSPHTFVV